MKTSLPAGFVFLSDIDPTIIENTRYYTAENFLGKAVPGYNTPRIICTKEAALALKEVNTGLKTEGYNLVVYDGYRPQRAVDEFIKWSQDQNDQVAKSLYYPTVNKEDVFELGYIAAKSGHSRGSTFDLTIIPENEKIKPIEVSSRTLNNGKTIPFLSDNTIDMGSSFDLFHEVSHHDTKLINDQQNHMRDILREAMDNHKFKEYSEEWWHYTLVDEPYPDTYFDFVVEN